MSAESPLAGMAIHLPAVLEKPDRPLGKLSDRSPKSLEELIERIVAYDPSADVGFVRKAYVFSEHAHQGQIRRSGEPYISHPLGVAAILADLRLDMQ